MPPAGGPPALPEPNARRADNLHSGMAMEKLARLAAANTSARCEWCYEIVQKTGIDEAQARGAADAVLGFLKERWPAPLASQIDAIIAGGGPGDLTRGLGDLGNIGDLGNRKVADPGTAWRPARGRGSPR